VTQPVRPLRELLDARTSEREIHEVWKGLAARRAARRSRRPLMLAAAVCLLSLVAVWLVRRPAAPSTPALDAAGPLAVTDGAGERLLAGGDAIVAPAALSDGSRLAVRPGARLSVVENSGRTFVTHLERGHADFSVKPGGPRRWIVECDGPTIEVVGTEFTVDRSPPALRVEVRHGVVLVRGTEVPGHLRRLFPGDVLELPAHAAAQSPEPTAAPSVQIPEPAPSAASATPSNDPATLYDEADRERRAGRSEEAARTLERAVAAAPHGQRAALGCFTLGRLYLDELGKPGAAAHAFERSLAAGPPLALEEDVRARLVEARARTSDVAGAGRAAEEYRSRFPGGRRAADVERWSRE